MRTNRRARIIGAGITTQKHGSVSNDAFTRIVARANPTAVNFRMANAKKKKTERQKAAVGLTVQMK